MISEVVLADNYLPKQVQTEVFSRGTPFGLNILHGQKFCRPQSQMCKVGAQLDVANVVDLSALKISISMMCNHKIVCAVYSDVLITFLAGPELAI